MSKLKQKPEFETSLYIANLGKYNEGFGIGKWITLPFTKEQFEQLLKDIQIDDEYYTEFAIHDYETELPIRFDEYDNVNDINNFIVELSNMSEHNQKAVLAYLETGEWDFLEEVIDVIKKGDWWLATDIEDEFDLGHHYFHSVDCVHSVYSGSFKWIEKYFNFAEYGEAIAEDGGWFTSYGWFKFN